MSFDVNQLYAELARGKAAQAKAAAEAAAKPPSAHVVNAGTTRLRAQAAHPIAAHAVLAAEGGTSIPMILFIGGGVLLLGFMAFGKKKLS